MERSECKYKAGRISLTEAYDDKSEKILQWPEVKALWDKEGKFLIKCPDCAEKVTLVDGLVRNGFFKHFHTGERKDTNGRKNEGGGTSAWHHRWQMRFPDHREKQITKGEDRADVLMSDRKLAIEFQKTDFAGTASDTCLVRTAYWNSKGFRIAWVFAWDGGSEFAGYFPRGTGKDGSNRTVMELPEYTKLFGENIVSRMDVEIHFLSLDGSFGFEFLPEEIDTEKKAVAGRVIPSYFQPFAPAYEPDMGKIRGKAVSSSHLVEPAVEAIDLAAFYKEAEKAEKLSHPEYATLYDEIKEKAFTLYDLIVKSISLDIKVLIVERPDKEGTEMVEYKIYPKDYASLVEKYAQYPRYTFKVKGKYRDPAFKEPGGDGYRDAPDIYSPEKKIWVPVWAVTSQNKKLDAASIFSSEK